MVLRSKKVKIRKPRQCFGCLETFQADSVMDLQVIADGEIQSVYSCRHCTALMPYYDDYGDGYPEGFAKDMMSDDGFKGTVEEYLNFIK